MLDISLLSPLRKQNFSETKRTFCPGNHEGILCDSVFSNIRAVNLQNTGFLEGPSGVGVGGQNTSGLMKAIRQDSPAAQNTGSYGGISGFGS